MRRGRRRWARWLAAAVSVLGLVLVADVVVTLLWQEPVSALRAWHAQRTLADQLDREMADLRPTPAERRTLSTMSGDRDRMAYLARRLRAHTSDGAPLGRIRLPSQGRSYVLVWGDSESDLRKGPGVYPSTTLPGAGGTTAIAGHRTTYLAPFRDIDDLRRGDRVELQMPYGTFTYAVDRHRIVDAGDVGVVRRAGPGTRLVLTACHPLYSAAQRIVVFAHLTRVDPDAQALGKRSGSRRAVVGTTDGSHLPAR
jgi:sortase A